MSEMDSSIFLKHGRLHDPLLVNIAPSFPMLYIRRPMWFSTFFHVSVAMLVTVRDVCMTWSKNSRNEALFKLI